MMLDGIFGIADKTALIIGDNPIAQATLALFTQAGATVELIDVATEEAAMADAYAGFVERHGRLDIVVYAASRIGTYALPDMTLAQWDVMHDINLRGAFIALRDAVRQMKGQGGGVIVAVSTMGSLHPVLMGNAAYGSSKAGLNALVRATALDHAGDGIRANTVLHGAVPCGQPASDAVQLGGPAMQPGRLTLGMGQPEDVASAILYLCSPAAKFITGQSLALDGGFLIS
ncbi:short chain dehydrogenase family protein [Blastomonas sp. RAC04]|uniref:SDR family NAD(P)-dependent oxidoreductase n=1 Tax=Blastomonas sp. RAC04 TaxID=1842535 RepID=UPI00083DE8E7|nr:SDR family oxidoreductase [Blastomonas sp. RAC04]AOG00646.1 short chain dehydrogenase family protein [Blastomonas sp. RAC04]